MTEERSAILSAYSRWTVLSALRSRAAAKAKKDLYSLLRDDLFTDVLDASRVHICAREFEEWHTASLRWLMSRDKRLSGQYGWAAKILNVYLKTYAYVGDGGRANLRSVLHPPIDDVVWRGVARQFRHRQDVLNLTDCVTTIATITTHDLYLTIVSCLRVVASELCCSLIEVEQLWTG